MPTLAHTKMPILPNSRHEVFAQQIAKGSSQSCAYVAAGYKEETRAANASALIRKPNVAARIAELRQRSVDKADITRAEIIQILAKYARSNPADYSDHTHEVRLKAIAQLTKMTGWDAPDKVELGASNELTELLARLRGSG